MLEWHRPLKPRCPHIIGMTDFTSREMRCGPTTFWWGERTYVMGIVNLTFDSFSGDGLADDVKSAVDLALRMEAEGADIIDIGAESTRPAGRVYGSGAQALSAEEELKRLLPVLTEVVSRVGVPVSVDTYKAEVARQAVEAGVSMINDVWGLQADPEMAGTAARSGVPIVLMHNQSGYQYGDLLADIKDRLCGAVSQAIEAGVDPANIIIDPGIGFGKTADHNLDILQRLPELRALGYPMLVGASRKSTIGRVLDLPVNERLEGTAATVALSIAGGADIVRVHDVREMVRVVRMSDAIVRGWRPEHWDG